jgi:hypothetical protein
MVLLSEIKLSNFFVPDSILSFSSSQSILKFEYPAEITNLNASSTLRSRYLTSFSATIQKNPVVGLGVVGINIFIILLSVLYPIRYFFSPCEVRN